MTELTNDEDPTAELREMAANRGCRLVKSRRRKPGGDFGRYGLSDAKSGKEIFGFGGSGLQASADEIADFLRKRTISTWESSIGAVRKGKSAKPPGQPAPAAPKAARKPLPIQDRRRRSDGEPKPGRPAPRRAAPEAPKPAPSVPVDPPRLRIRVADAVDGEALAALLGQLGFEASADELADRIGRLSRMAEPVLVAKLDDQVAGCLTWHVMTVLHRPLPVGRITMLVVAETARRKGIGRALVEAAEARLTARGCGLVEVTSNVKLRAAHAFYRHLGYDQTSHRFAKALNPDGAD
jgi:GNAT superfamily N-acetyltransferase